MEISSTLLQSVEFFPWKSRRGSSLCQLLPAPQPDAASCLGLGWLVPEQGWRGRLGQGTHPRGQVRGLGWVVGLSGVEPASASWCPQHGRTVTIGPCDL